MLVAHDYVQKYAYLKKKTFFLCFLDEEQFIYSAIWLVFEKNVVLKCFPFQELQQEICFIISSSSVI